MRPSCSSALPLPRLLWCGSPAHRASVSLQVSSTLSGSVLVALETRSAATQSAPCAPCQRASFPSRLPGDILFLPVSTVRARTPSRVHPAQPQEPAHVFLRIKEQSFRREHAFIERLIGLAPVFELGRRHHLMTETSRLPDLQIRPGGIECDMGYTRLAKRQALVQPRGVHFRTSREHPPPHRFGVCPKRCVGASSQTRNQSNPSLPLHKGR
jgi:hypothetical protein